MKKSLLLASVIGLISMAASSFAAATVEFAKDVAVKAHDSLFGYMANRGLVLGMTTLAVNKPRVYGSAGQQISEYPVIAADIIYEGAAVGENGSGYARPLVAADPFLGFASAQADNSTGAAGAKTVEVKSAGLIRLAIAALAITANDHPLVYASDDDTFTLTAGSNTAIGRVQRWDGTGFAIVRFDSGLAWA